MFNKKHVVKTPSIIQMEAAECGAASLGIVLAHWGLWLPLEELRLQCGVNRDGSKASNIVRAARKYGCEAKGYRWPAEVLYTKEAPIIIHWEFNHFVVFEGCDKDKVYLNDPARGHRFVDKKDFKESYTGIALNIKPGPDFQKKGARYNVIKDIAKKLLEDRPAVMFVLLIGACLVVPGLAMPIYKQVFLDDILTGKHADWMTNLCIAIGFTIFLQSVLVGLRLWLLTRWQTKLTLSDSSSFFWHILRLPMNFFQQRFGAEVAARVSLNESVANVLSGSAATAFLDFFVSVLYLVLLLQYSVSLTLIGIFFSLINISMVFLLRKKIVEISMKVEQDAGKEYGTAMNGLLMIETLKANGNEADFFAKWVGYRVKAVAGEQKMALLSQTFTMVPLLLGGINSALIMAVGGFSIMDGLMTAGIFIAFQGLMGNFQEPFNKLVSLGQTLQTTEMQMQRLSDVKRYAVDRLNYGQDEEEKVDIGKDRLSGKVSLKKVVFGYSPLDEPLLVDFDLAIEPGHWVALVGASGSGKSTVAKVITGFYEEWSGEVSFDDVLRKRISRSVITNSLSSVEQSTFLFSGTVHENISLFDDSILRRSVIRAAKDACIHEDILCLDGAYDSEILESGSNFSGGQRQRLEIACALANNPSILVLDEATSALDPITEQNVLKNIRRRGCTCIVVAHRLSTIRDCDEIIVLDRGKVVERGTHEEMIKNNSYYSKLVVGKD